MLQNLGTVDLVVIVAYFLAVLGVAWWAARRKKVKGSDYFLAGREAGWLLVGASLFVSNIGSEHLVGLAGSGAAGGLAVGHFEWLAALILLLLGWLFVPFYLRSGVYTMPEFLARRYNSACCWYFTIFSIVSYVLTKISVALYAGGIIIREVTGMSLWYSAGAVVISAGVYTVAGGLRAVLFTDTLQAFVLVAGTGLLLFMGLNEAGGWSALVEKAPECRCQRSASVSSMATGRLSCGTPYDSTAATPRSRIAIALASIKSSYSRLAPATGPIDE